MYTRIKGFVQPGLHEFANLNLNSNHTNGFVRAASMSIRCHATIHLKNQGFNLFNTTSIPRYRL